MEKIDINSIKKLSISGDEGVSPSVTIVTSIGTNVKYFDNMQEAHKYFDIIFSSVKDHFITIQI